MSAMPKSRRPKADPLASIRWWWRDWRSSKARATLDPLGRLAYLELLFVSHGEPDCALPGDDASLALLSGLTEKQWAKIRDAVLGQFDRLDDGRYVNDKMRREWRKAMHHRKTQRAKAARRWSGVPQDERSSIGRNAAKARWLGKKSRCKPDASRISRAYDPDASLPSPSPSPSPETPQKESPPDARARAGDPPGPPVGPSGPPQSGPRAERTPEQVEAYRKFVIDRARKARAAGEVLEWPDAAKAILRDAGEPIP